LMVELVDIGHAVVLWGEDKGILGFSYSRRGRADKGVWSDSVTSVSLFIRSRTLCQRGLSVVGKQTFQDYCRRPIPIFKLIPL
jgi:hypothetical protein